LLGVEAMYANLGAFSRRYDPEHFYAAQRSNFISEY
jgi:hypothetical protein